MKTRSGKEIGRRVLAVLHLENADPLAIDWCVVRFCASHRATLAAIALGQVDHHYPFAVRHSNTHLQVACWPTHMHMAH